MISLHGARRLGLCILSAVVLAAPPVRGEEKAKTLEQRPVAVSDCETGVLLRRQAPDKPWWVVTAKEKLPSGQMLLAIDVGGAIVSDNGAVRLGFRGDFNGNSPFPILETAVSLGRATDVDLEVTVDRGRIDLTNLKAKGPARVRLHIRDLSGEVVLVEPGSRMSVEIYGRWPRGVPFTKVLKPGDGPAVAVIFLAIKGEVELKGKMNHLVLRAPPGPALLHADGLHAIDPAPAFLEKLPDWAVDGLETERGKQLKELLGRFRKNVLAKGVDAAVDELYKSEDPLDRRCAVVIMGALDDLPRLGQALLNARTADVWDAAVRTLRHWIGRAPGQDQKLYQGLIEKRGYKPREAESVLQLLHSFGDDELARPELYEVLINYLNNDQLALRGLAHWHLVRLVPAGKKIAYDPLGPKDQRERAVQEWHKLIPSGKLPPAEKQP